MNKNFINFLTYNNIDIGDTDLTLCRQIYQLGKSCEKKEIQNQIWHEIEETPKIKINRTLCILTKYGDVYEIETIFACDFEEFIFTHTCLKWSYLDTLISKTTQIEYRIKSKVQRLDDSKSGIRIMG